MKTWKTILSSLKHSKIYILLFMVLSLLLNLLITYIPIIIQYFIDVLLKQETKNELLDKIVNEYQDKIGFIYVICIVLIIVQLAIILITYIRTNIKNKIMQEFQYRFKQNLFEYIQALTYQDFYKNSLADLLQNATDDINNIVQFFEKGLTFILDILLVMIFAIMQLFSVDYRLSSIMIVLSFIIVSLSIWYFKKSKPIAEERIKTVKNIYTKLEDNFNNLKFIKLNNLQEQEEIEFKTMLEENYNASKNKVKMDTKYQLGIENIVKLRTTLYFYFKCLFI